VLTAPKPSGNKFPGLHRAICICAAGFFFGTNFTELPSCRLHTQRNHIRIDLFASSGSAQKALRRALEMKQSLINASRERLPLRTKEGTPAHRPFIDIELPVAA